MARFVAYNGCLFPHCYTLQLSYQHSHLSASAPGDGLRAPGLAVGRGAVDWRCGSVGGAEVQLSVDCRSEFFCLAAHVVHADCTSGCSRARTGV